MKNLIVVRHGNYIRETGKLSDFGEKQIAKLTPSIYNLKGKFGFACSPALRAEDSKIKLIQGLDVPGCLEECVDFGFWEELSNEGDYLDTEEAKKIHERVNKVKNSVDNLILISHFSVATGYSTYFMQKEFEDIRGIENIPMGKAVLVDLIKEDYDIIP